MTDKGRDNITPGEENDYDKKAEPLDNQETGEVCSTGEPFPGFLELVYGVLFEPRRTMKRVAEKPPLGLAVLIVTVLSLFGTLTGLFIILRFFEQSLLGTVAGGFIPGGRGIVILIAVLGLLVGYARWFGYSAVMHLVADLLGGRGCARGVFAVAGLATLPSILKFPVQILAYWYGMESLAASAAAGLAGLAAGIWSFIILVIGINQVHGLSTGRSVLVVIAPVLALIILVFLTILSILVLIMAFSSTGMNFPGYF